jgi:hypothetical protein
VDGESDQPEVLKEISLGLDKSLECVGKFCYLGELVVGQGRHLERE